MTHQEIIDNNKLIAIFMDNYQKLSNDPEFGRFHLQWDWLMPVIEKIEEMDVVASFQIEQPTIYIWKSSENSTFKDIEIDIFKSSKLEAVYKAVIEFIKWYNKQNK